MFLFSSIFLDTLHNVHTIYTVLFIGFNPDIIEYRGVNFVIWDLKGGSKVVRKFFIKIFK